MLQPLELLNWYLCFAIIGLGISKNFINDRLVILGVVIISFVGHYISPIVYNMEYSWKIWGLYGASVNFLKLVFVLFLCNKNSYFLTPLARWLSFIFLCNLFVHMLNHIDWAVLETEFLSITLFTVSVASKTYTYDAYKILVQFFNFMALICIYVNWISRKLGQGEGSGDNQSGSDNYTFLARNNLL